MIAISVSLFEFQQETLTKIFFEMTKPALKRAQKMIFIIANFYQTNIQQISSHHGCCNSVQRNVSYVFPLKLGFLQLVTIVLIHSFFASIFGFILLLLLIFLFYFSVILSFIFCHATFGFLSLFLDLLLKNSAL